MQAQNPNGLEVEILETVTHGVAEHLSQALELLFVSVESNMQSPILFEREKGHRYAISSAIHSFCAFEHAVNFILFYRYKKPGNPFFREIKNRTVLETKFVQALQDQDVLTKFRHLIESINVIENTADLQGRLREIRDYRNCLCHGYIEEKTLLLQEVAGTKETTESDGKTIHKTLFETVDVEYGSGNNKNRWKSKVPLTKLNPPDAMIALDAFKVLRICAGAIDYLGVACGMEFGAAWSFKSVTRHVALGKRSAVVAGFPYKETMADITKLFNTRCQYFDSLNQKRARRKSQDIC
ncbi:MAG: hypothetical protein WA902_12370 [Thermosynechococcaceae cyanobacterium]